MALSVKVEVAVIAAIQQGAEAAAKREDGGSPTPYQDTWNVSAYNVRRKVNEAVDVVPEDVLIGAIKAAGAGTAIELASKSDEMWKHFEPIFDEIVSQHKDDVDGAS